MLHRQLQRAYRRLGPRYPGALVSALLQLNYPVIVLAIALLALYVDVSAGEFLRLVFAGAVAALAYNLSYQAVARGSLHPVRRWLAGDRGPESTRSAWRSCASFPQEMLRRETSPRSLGAMVLLVNLGWCLYATWVLDFPAYAAPLLFAGILVYVGYILILRFLLLERIMRPLVEDLAGELVGDSPPEPARLALRWRLLAGLPAINVFSGVAAAGLVGGGSGVGDLAVAVAASVAVAVTVSLVLTLLLSGSITAPVAQLRDAAESVGGGDFAVQVPVVTTDEIGDLTRSFNRMTAGLAERERIREAFGTYVDREIAEHILKEGTDLEGEEVELTAMFIDIRDFTAFAEHSPPRAVVTRLNRLFGRIVPVIHSHHGHVDKFIGDGLLAVFGAPRRLADHAGHAFAAALEVTRVVDDEFAGELEIGIGLNSGTVVVGNVGGAGRLDFSVIGDTINVAARVEAATRQTGDTILASDNTRRLLGGDAIGLEKRSDMPLKGRSGAVALYAPSRSDSDTSRHRQRGQLP